MPEKPKRSWKETHTMIAVVAMITQLALCNIFASVDRQRIEKKADPTEIQPIAPTLTAEPTLEAACPTIIPKRNMGAKCIARTRSS